MTRDRPRLPSPTPGLIAREVGDEYFVVHPGTQVAHSLSGLAGQVWAAAADDAPFPDADPDAVDDTVDALIELELLAPERVGLTRRRLLEVGGAAAAALGVLSVPLPAAAAGCSGGPTFLSISPATMSAGTNNQAEQITGTGFVTGASVTVTFSSGPANNPVVTVGTVSVLNSSTINTSFSASNKGASGSTWSYTITVTNPNGCAATSSAVFTVTK